MESIWTNPCSPGAFPSFSEGSNGDLILEEQNRAWLELRPEIDPLASSQTDTGLWQLGIKEIAQFFANSAPWTFLASSFTEACSKKFEGFVEMVLSLISKVLLSFGPWPYLARVEEFYKSLLFAISSKISKKKLPLSEILCSVANCSCSWPRKAKLELFERVLPRMIIYAAHALKWKMQLPSIKGDSSSPESGTLALLFDLQSSGTFYSLMK